MRLPVSGGRFQIPVAASCKEHTCRQPVPAIVRAELQAWMIKAWKAIIDTNGHYARPDLVRLNVTDHAPSQFPVVRRTQPSPALLAEAAERNSVEPARVESIMHDVARLTVAGTRADSST